MEKYFRMGKNEYIAFMNTQKAYDETDIIDLECSENSWCGRAVTGRSEGTLLKKKVHV